MEITAGSRFPHEVMQLRRRQRALMIDEQRQERRRGFEYREASTRRPFTHTLF